MLVSDSLVSSMRDFQEEAFGPMHDEYHEMLPGNTHLLGSLFDEGLTITADRQNPFVVNDRKLPVVFRILLHLGSLLRPIQVFRHPLFQLGHLAHLHGVFSLRFCSALRPIEV